MTRDSGAWEDRGWVALSPVCRLYLKGQHYVLWLREARSEQIRWRGHAKDKGNAASKKEQSHKTKNMDEIEQHKREIKGFKTGMHIHIVAYCNAAHRHATHSPIIERKVQSELLDVRDCQRVKKNLWLSKLLLKKNKMMYLSLNS